MKRLLNFTIAVTLIAVLVYIELTHNLNVISFTILSLVFLALEMYVLVEMNKYEFPSKRVEDEIIKHALNQSLKSDIIESKAIRLNDKEFDSFSKILGFEKDKESDEENETER